MKTFVPAVILVLCFFASFDTAHAGMQWCKCGEVVSSDEPNKNQEHRSSNNFDFTRCGPTGGGPICLYASVNGENVQGNGIFYDIKIDKAVAVDPTIKTDMNNGSPCFYPTGHEFNDMSRWYIANPKHSPQGGFRIRVWRGWAD